MLKKLLIKLLNNSLYQPEAIDVQKMQDWLWKAYKDEGFKHYYSMRKKYLVNLLLLDIPDKERAETRGRLSELKALSSNITAEYKKRNLNK